MSRAYTKFMRVLTSPWTVAAISLLGFAFLREMENEWFTMPFSISVLMVLASLVFLLSRRLAFSVYTAWALLGTITVVSFIKYREQGFSLHAYDIVFVGGDSSLYTFLLHDYFHLAMPVLLLAAAAVAGLALVRRAEPERRIGLPARVLLPVGASLLLPATIPATAAIDRHEYIVGGHHASAFFVSLLDVASLLQESELQARLEAQPEPEPFADIVSCAPEGQRPDVFVVLSETQSPPFNFPQLNIPRDFADGFLSDDGRTHALRVETMGGGTWITNFSLMTGLSATDFGWQRPYVTIALQNKVGGTLPELMARCGYRTASILPVEFAFVNEGPFMLSSGFETVLDSAAIGAPSDHERDSFYYEAANRFIAEHRETDGRPLFLLVQTMFSHGPYNERLAPGETVPGEPLSANGEINEYLRRVHVARDDFRAFLGKQRAEVGDRGAVMLEFGDHQSSVTMPFVNEIEGPAALSDPDSLAYVTHYTVHGMGYDFAGSMPDLDRLDVAYLGASFMHATGIATSPLIEDVVRLRDACGGRFHSCPDRALVDRHLRRRAASGFLDVLDGDLERSVRLTD